MNYVLLKKESADDIARIIKFIESEIDKLAEDHLDLKLDLWSLSEGFCHIGLAFEEGIVISNISNYKYFEW